MAVHCNRELKIIIFYSLVRLKYYFFLFFSPFFFSSQNSHNLSTLSLNFQTSHTTAPLTHAATDPALTTATTTTTTTITSVTNPTIPTLIKPTTTLVTNPTTPTIIKPTTTKKKKRRSKHRQTPQPKSITNRVTTHEPLPD